MTVNNDAYVAVSGLTFIADGSQICEVTDASETSVYSVAISSGNYTINQLLYAIALQAGISAGIGSNPLFSYDYSSKEFTFLEEAYIGPNPLGDWYIRNPTTDLRDFLGVTADGDPHNVFDYSWGYARCVLEGAYDPSGKSADCSKLQNRKPENPEFEITTNKGRKYVSNAGFSKDDFLRTWKLESVWIPEGKDQWVVDFLHSCTYGKSDSEIVRLYNLPDFMFSSFKNGSSTTFKVDLKMGEFPTDNVLEKSLWKFTLALQEVSL